MVIALVQREKFGYTAADGCTLSRAETSDEDLMRAYVASGDRQAFQVLFERYGARITAYFLRGIGDRNAASDLTQTTFLHVHRARRDYDPSRPFRPWLYTIAANVRREYWRRRKRKPEEFLEPGTEDRVGSVQPDASTATDRLVRRALAQLPDNQKDVMLLRWYGGLTFPEIGASLGIKTTTAKVRAHRAAQALKALLGGNDG